ncbi:CUE domain-containing protein, partial [Colletotrichum musicola]
MAQLPPFAPFPPASWLSHLTTSDWDSLTTAWTTLAQAHLALPEAQLSKAAAPKDETPSSLTTFLSTFIPSVAESGPSPLGANAKPLLRAVFTLTSRLLTSSQPPPGQLTTAPFLSSFAKLFRKNAPATLSKAFDAHPSAIETSLHPFKKNLTKSLEAGLKSDLRLLESRLALLNHLLHASSQAAAFFLAGSDFLDALVSAYKITNPPLRKVLIATSYLCLVGIAEAGKMGMLADVLFSLKSAAETHRQSVLNVNDSLVAELVTATPVLRQLLKKAEEKGAASTALRTRISALEGFRKPGGAVTRPKRLVKRKVDKGKGVADKNEAREELHAHRQSQIALIQDLFPDLGSAFVSKLFDEYGDNTEAVTAHLLEDSLPEHLAHLDRSEQLSPLMERRYSHDIAPRPTPPQLPQRHNVFDDDEL